MGDMRERITVMPTHYQPGCGSAPAAHPLLGSGVSAQSAITHTVAHSSEATPHSHAQTAMMYELIRFQHKVVTFIQVAGELHDESCRLQRMLHEHDQTHERLTSMQHLFKRIATELQNAALKTELPPHANHAMQTISEAPASISSRLQSSCMRGRRHNHRQDQLAVLCKWAADHRDDPYPTQQEKEELARTVDMRVQQVDYCATVAARTFHLGY